MKITDLYFGITRWDSNTNTIREENLFSSTKILHSVAKYVLNDCMLPPYLFNSDPLSFLFSSTRGRIQYEMSVSDKFRETKAVPTDVYAMYVEPNRNHLLWLINQVSKNSARIWLREEKRRLRG